MAGGNASCGVNYFCIGAFLIFIGSVLLCALSFTIVLPYVATRDWPEVTCHVTNTTYNFLQCMCDQQVYEEDLGCITKYPCLEIHVRYRVSRSSLANVTGLKIIRRHDVDGDATTTTTIRLPDRRAADADDDAPGLISVLKTKEALVNYSHVKSAREGKAPEANTVDKFDADADADAASSVHASQMDIDRANVDPRSTLPYSGPPLTSQANVATDGDVDVTSDDTIWIATTLFRWWSDSFYGKCSLHECGVEEWNTKEAARFKSAWGSLGQSYRCYYRPDSPNVVILSKTPLLAVIHAVVWPALSLAFGWLLWFGLCAGCCSLDKGEDYAPDHYR